MRPARMRACRDRQACQMRSATARNCFARPSRRMSSNALAPSASTINEIVAPAATFGYSLGVGALPVKRVPMKPDRRHRYSSGRPTKPLEIPEDVHITPRMYQKLTQKIAGKPEERILSYLMLRSLKLARYSAENEGHFALAAPTYTHFTSPIRRYPDLIVHRILKEVCATRPSARKDVCRWASALGITARLRRRGRSGSRSRRHLRPKVRNHSMLRWVDLFLRPCCKRSPTSLHSPSVAPTKPSAS